MCSGCVPTPWQDMHSADDNQSTTTTIAVTITAPPSPTHTYTTHHTPPSPLTTGKSSLVRRVDVGLDPKALSEAVAAIGAKHGAAVAALLVSVDADKAKVLAVAGEGEGGKGEVTAGQEAMGRVEIGVQNGVGVWYYSQPTTCLPPPTPQAVCSDSAGPVLGRKDGSAPPGGPGIGGSRSRHAGCCLLEAQEGRGTYCLSTPCRLTATVSSSPRC